MDAKYSLDFGIGMDPSVWDKNKGDGVDFYVYIALSDEPDKVYRVFYRYLDPKNHPEDRQWVDVQVNLNQFEGKQVLINFVTTSGPNHNSGQPGVGQHYWKILTILLNKQFNHEMDQI